MDTPIKAWLDTYGTGYRISGYNVFMQKNRALEQAGSLLLPVPANANQPAPSALTFVTGIGVAGDIDLTWTDNSGSGFTQIRLAVRLSSANVFELIATIPSVDGTATLNGLTAGADYDCYGIFQNPTTGELSTSAGQLAVAAKA